MPNVGKTCFVINFAEYLGLDRLKLSIKQPAGYTSIRSYSVTEAREQLVSPESNFTDSVQSIDIEIPSGKVIKKLKIIDSCGLGDGIHPEYEVRLAMATTIRLIKNSDLILHIIDLTQLNMNSDELLQSVDKMIMNYASLEKNYAILANKVDLKTVKDRVNLLKNVINDKVIIPISALYKYGFKEVKKLVLSYV
ncbi:GTPase domain-containing protein [Halothermothrix orenii]|nr:GTPase domain-containing protein [Halothermothrix orenii]